MEAAHRRGGEGGQPIEIEEVEVEPIETSQEPTDRALDEERQSNTTEPQSTNARRKESTPARAEDTKLWVREQDLEVTDHVTSKEWMFNVEALLPNGRKQIIAHGTAELGANGKPLHGPEFLFDKRVTLGGKELRITVGDQASGKSVSLSDLALDRATELFKARYGHAPDDLPGSLAFENKANFQNEYIKALDRGLPPNEAEVAAVKNISFGRARLERGYTDISVTTSGTEDIMYGDPRTSRSVPKNIDVKARRP